MYRVVKHDILMLELTWSKKMKDKVPVTPYLRSVNSKIKLPIIIYSICVIVITVFSLLGYIPGLGMLGSISGSYIPMAPSTAISFIVLSGILFTLPLRSLSESSLPVSFFLTRVVTLFATLEIVGYFTDLDLNFEDALVPATAQLGQIPIGRMSLYTGVLFLLSGLAILALLARVRENNSKINLRDLSGVLGALTLGTAFIVCLTYLFGSHLLYGQGTTIPMTLTTALAFIMLGAAIVGASGKGSIPLRWFSSTTNVGIRAELSEGKRLFSLAMLMVLVSLMVMTITIVMSYRQNITEHRKFLMNTVQSQARLIEAIARYDAINDKEVQGVYLATIGKIIDAHNHYKGFGDTGEFTLAQLEGDKIEFIIQNRSDSVASHQSLPFDSQLAQPMRLALKGLSGTIIGLDYRGEIVIAAYEPVAILNMGLVVKIDLEEFRKPFIQTGLTTIVIAFILILGATAIFFRLGQPIITQLRKHNNNISELRQAEESVTSLGKIITQSLNEIFIFDAESFEFVYANNGALKNIGYTIEELKYQTPVDIQPEYTLEKFTELTRPLRTGAKDKVVFTTFYERKDKSFYDVEVHLQLSEYIEKKAYIATILDMTERKQAEKDKAKQAWELIFANNEISAQTKRLSAIINNIMDALITISECGIIETFNPAATKMFGYTEEEVIGQNIKMLMPEPHHKEHTSYLDNFITTGEKKVIGIEQEVKGRYKDGTIFPMKLAISETYINGERLFIGIIRDITEYKRTEKLLRRSQKMETIGELTGGIAHDFNNLLGIIIGNHDLMGREIEDGSKQQKRLNNAQNAALRGAEITRRLLNFSRQSEEAHSPVKINQIIGEFKDFIHKSITASIHLEIHITQDLWLVDLNPGDFQDAIINLSLNARDAMSSGGRLIIEARNIILDHNMTDFKYDLKAGEYVQISVSDSGTGMTKETADRIFDPFFTTKDKSKGTGLGLAMVFGFVKRCNGSINVYSEEGEGTSFKIYLPRSQSTTDSYSKRTNIDKILPTGNETVLIVDDEEELVAIAKSVLEDLGYTTYYASSGDRALEIITHNDEIDIVFSDIVMPGNLSGFDLAEAVVAVNPEIKILLTSGFTGKMKHQEAHQKWSLNLLNKPYRDLELAEAIRKTLDN
jgi:PAS domain S-box-containing protein